MILRDRCVSALVGVAIAAALAAGPASAQQNNTVAQLKEAEGNVLVSSGDAMIAAGGNQRLAVGTRVVTTAGAKVTISYDVGCDVKLKENERFTVTTGPCAVLLTQVEALGPAAGAIGGGTAGTAAAGGAAGVAGLGGAVTAFSIAGGIIAVGVIEETRKNNTVSPH